MNLADIDIRNERVLASLPLAALPLCYWIRDVYDAQGKPGLDRLEALLSETPRLLEPVDPVEEAPAATGVVTPTRPVSYPPDGAHTNPGYDYTEADIARLKAELTYPGPYRLFEMIATRCPAWVWKGEVEDDLGMSSDQLRNELASLTKLTGRLFGTKAWPFEPIRHNGVSFYRCNPTIAAWWTGAP